MSEPVRGKSLTWARALWAVLIALSVYYLWRAIQFRFIAPDKLGPSLFDKQTFFFAHLLLAAPILVIGPLQFNARLRQARPKLHRTLGRVYVASACGAALTAIYLGATIELEGSRLPIVLLGAVWLFFSVAAWRCAVRRNFIAHRQFMIRSYGIALVLVWLRLLGDIPPDLLFFYIEDEAIRDTTLEWLSWVLPLLVLEFSLTWLPLLRGNRSFRRTAA